MARIATEVTITVPSPPLVITDLAKLLPPPQVCEDCEGSGTAREGRHGYVEACPTCNGEGLI